MDTGHSTNLIGIPTGLLASTAFNDYPLALHINGVRETNPVLFGMLAQAADAEEAADAFQTYMAAVFGLDQKPHAGGRRRFRSSYLRLLQGWGFDSNGPEGAVLKGWVESRFGLFATYHKEPLDRVSSPAWAAYVEEKMSSRFHNNSINLQLDLLYEFCQWALAHFHAPGGRHLTLFRGTNDFAEHQVRERPARGKAVVRLNSLVSLTSQRTIADEFGDYILEIAIPIVKVLFFKDLLTSHALKGEAEYLVIGGDYRVHVGYL